MRSWPLRSERVEATVLETAAVLWGATFRLPSGRSFAPFAAAPWAGALDGDPDQPGHMRRLGGEFACLPFGGAPARDLPPGWPGPPAATADEPQHGPAADEPWRCLGHNGRSIALALDYPPDHAVRRLVRTIRLDPARPRINLTLRIEARVKARTSVGVHPILTLDVPPESLTLDARFAFGLAYPAELPGAPRLTREGARFATLDAVPGRADRTFDGARWPKGHAAEDLFQLCGAQGLVDVRFEAWRAGLRLTWDRAVLPSCLVWVSDRAVREAPWGVRFRGLGVEPVAAAFDLPNAVSVGPNPIADGGVRTAVELDPAEPAEIAYRLEAFDLAA